jgi:hypothetical protein
MKKIILILLILIILLLTSCTLFEKELAYDPEILDNGYENLDFSCYFTIGYYDYENVLKNIENINYEILKNIPVLNMCSIKIYGNVYEERNKLKNLTNIRFIEPFLERKLIYSKDTVTRNLDYYQYALDLIDADNIWKYNSGNDVIIAVIDTGIDGTHPDLFNSFVDGYDPGDPMFPSKIIKAGSNYQSDSTTSDDHGTHVAGIINSNGIIKGLAYNAKVMNILAFRAFFTGGYYYVGDVYVADGIVYAVENGADILNISWGGEGYSQVLKEAIDYALERNVIVVAASGNNNTNMKIYPASYPGVIGVASVNPQGRLSSFSNFGINSDVSAPGSNIISTIPVSSSSMSYSRWSGTSMATPYVSALAAILKSNFKDATNNQIMKMIIDKSIYVEEDNIKLIHSSIFEHEPYSYPEKTELIVITEPHQVVHLNGKKYYSVKSNDEGKAYFKCIEEGVYKIISSEIIKMVNVKGVIEINLKERIF